MRDITPSAGCKGPHRRAGGWVDPYNVVANGRDVGVAVGAERQVVEVEGEVVVNVRTGGPVDPGEAA